MLDRITHDPNILAGRATLRGLRISVAHVVNLVANGMTPAQIVAEHPDLEEEDVRQAQAYAAAIAEDEVMNAHARTVSSRSAMRSRSSSCASPRFRGSERASVRSLSVLRPVPGSGRKRRERRWRRHGGWR